MSGLSTSWRHVFRWTVVKRRNIARQLSELHAADFTSFHLAQPLKQSHRQTRPPTASTREREKENSLARLAHSSDRRDVTTQNRWLLKRINTGRYTPLLDSEPDVCRQLLGWSLLDQSAVAIDARLLGDELTGSVRGVHVSLATSTATIDSLDQRRVTLCPLEPATERPEHWLHAPRLRWWSREFVCVIGHFVHVIRRRR